MRLSSSVSFAIFMLLGVAFHGPGQAQEQAALLSKADAGQMFNLSEAAWKANLRQMRAAGVGNFQVSATGEYTMYVRPDAASGILAVSPSYRPGQLEVPWRLSITVLADTEPAGTYYRSMSPDTVEELVKRSANEMSPEFSVMGYMVRRDGTPPAVYFTIFKAGDFPLIDQSVREGDVCPTSGGKPACIRTSMMGN